jgi:hypothetical protein
LQLELDMIILTISEECSRKLQVKVQGNIEGIIEGLYKKKVND